MADYIMALDAGTTSCRCILFDKQSRICSLAQKEFKTCSNQPQAKGTRAHMVSMYVLYYAPVQMMCDSATEYLKAPDILNFIANTPTTWDDTKALDGKIGEFVVVARRSGDNWYVGGMNDWIEREVEIDFSKILP